MSAKCKMQNTYRQFEATALCGLNRVINAVYCECTGELFRIPVLAIALGRRTDRSKQDNAIIFRDAPDLSFVEYTDDGLSFAAERGLIGPSSFSFIGYEFDGKAEDWSFHVDVYMKRQKRREESLKKDASVNGNAM
jgi:hypothetical protein